ncbi:hypothetical protein ACQ33O_13300 [Ferruginibacter sp. SUN002]|uniref:hypothetical protein n=1 Tax=Ferruginibacter sp. SUN002 TaxID=2937789 RepID=UPI003D36BFA5
MAATFEIGILWTVFKDVRDFLTGNAENNINAHEAINDAFINTYDYLKNKNGEYLPNPNLAKDWNKASAAVMRINPNLGELLYHKSRFWLDPQLYINLNRADEIIKLKEIVDEMERIRIKL